MDRIFSLRKAVKGQAIIEYVVFIAMFSLAIIVFSNRGFFQRVIQGRTRSAIAQSVGVEQFDESSGVFIYTPRDFLLETPPEEIFVNDGAGAVEPATIQSLNPWLVP